jgi:hypothetical protein
VGILLCKNYINGYIGLDQITLPEKLISWFNTDDDLLNRKNLKSLPHTIQIILLSSFGDWIYLI